MYVCTCPYTSRFLVKLNTACLVALCVIVVLLIAVAAVEDFAAHFHECTCTC